MERGGIGKAQGVGGFGGRGVRAEQEAARKIPASLFNQTPVRRGFLLQFSLQRAAADPEVPGSVVEPKIPAAQTLANEAENALREIGLGGIHREKLVGGRGDYLMRHGIGAAHREIEQRAIKEQRSDRHAEAHRRPKNAGVLGNVLGLRVREPDLARRPCGAFRETVEARDCGHGHFDIVARFRERAEESSTGNVRWLTRRRD